MLAVGVTGGIGSGKTTVAKMFSDLGIEIVDTDVIARQIVEPGTKCLTDIAAHFGQDILLADGSLDRRMLRDIIFSNTEEKIWLEGLLHPIVRLEILDQYNKAKSDYVILCSPLIFETNQTALVDRVLVVDVPQGLQISRTVSRDHVSEEQTKKITENQIQRDRRLELADDLIDNSGSLEETRKQVEHLHKYYLSLSASA